MNLYCQYTVADPLAAHGWTDNHKLTHFHFQSSSRTGLLLGPLKMRVAHVHSMIRLHALTFKLGVKINAWGRMWFSHCCRNLVISFVLLNVFAGPCICILLNREFTFCCWILNTAGFAGGVSVSATALAVLVCISTCCRKLYAHLSVFPYVRSQLADVPVCLRKDDLYVFPVCVSDWVQICVFSFHPH